MSDETAAPALRLGRDEAGLLRGLVASDSATVVLSSLARHSARWFSDSATLELSDGPEPPFRITFPQADALPTRPGATTTGAGPDGAHAIRIVFEEPAALGYGAFSGSLFHSWSSRGPRASDRVVAQLLVEVALTAIRAERLAAAAQAADSRSAALAGELVSGRIVGQAVGIVMVQDGVTSEQAHERLRDHSRRRREDLAETAAAIIHRQTQQAGRRPGVLSVSSARDDGPVVLQRAR